MNGLASGQTARPNSNQQALPGAILAVSRREG
jgi:hypothetical protein